MTSISKDVERGAYTASDWRDPAGLGPGPHTLTIAPGDLDPQGCFYFQDGAGQPLIFVASKLKLGLGSGLLNFDLIGTFFDFDVSSTGKWANGKADNWYSSEIQNFWVKGKVALKSKLNLKLSRPEDGSESSVSTRSLSTARSVCSGRCSASDVYYGVRRHTEDTFHCKCFDRAMGTVVAEVEVHIAGSSFALQLHM